jgi:cellulose synthase/poly-beta-1,6-N-acetylglucosamine synthase-like glycosyltransferase
MSIESVLASADALADPRSVRLVIACDSCNDATPRIARDIAERDERVAVIEGTWKSSGACRAAAIRHALSGLPGGAALTDTWVATTDADTIVPADWLSSHAVHWSQGDHAVAGVVDLLDDHDAVRNVFSRHYALGHDSHGHVHGANLGIRADAYLSVEGFPPVDLAEDHALWQALRHAGFTCRSSVALRVATSARLTGRAVGGFADTLRVLMSERLHDPGAAATA